LRSQCIGLNCLSIEPICQFFNGRQITLSRFV